ncbi:RtcB family protein [Myxococcota bacterium]|nr:RtcB family protein [Myxococcota bacterium]
MRPKELQSMGIPRGLPFEAAIAAAKEASRQGYKKGNLRKAFSTALGDPQAYIHDPLFGEFARAILAAGTQKEQYVPRAESAPCRIWGQDIERGALTQMENACALPVSLRGALMPDAHEGYGLPIGGVLGVKDAVIPFAVGMDIACRMCMSVLDLPLSALERKTKRLESALEKETGFGVGVSFKERQTHGVMDLDWSVSPVTAGNKDFAWAQLGTSGSGNHFVEFGELTLQVPVGTLAPGTYLALLSHSGSRGTGAKLAEHYSTLARNLHAELPKELIYLAWLPLASHEGQEYWRAMELMGEYARANHEIIHHRIARHVGSEILMRVENHHNYAWIEEHFGESMVVHRKGATPAGIGATGIIPGSMATAAYVVRGRGEPESLNSASHGAGRRMSRKAALSRFSAADAGRYLKNKGVKILSAGLDELPMAYKNIHEVMAAQEDLVETLGHFMPRIVKMAPSGPQFHSR